MTLVKFIKETTISTLSSEGPGSIVYEADSEHDLPEDYSRFYAANGNAVILGGAGEPKRPTSKKTRTAKKTKAEEREAGGEGEQEAGD